MATPLAAADLADCADEPIRLPGAIQPHGRLLVLDADSHRLLACSANWRDRAEIDAACAAVSLADAPAPDEVPALVGRPQVAGAAFDASAHRLGARLYLEFEPAAPAAAPPIYQLARHAVPALQKARSVEALCALAVRELKRLTGFGRCLAYRFDAEGHGEVLAESLDAGYDSYAGHRFPASDIPAQARALYCLNYIRVIPDAAYEPVPLRALDAGLDPLTIDLSMASLRSVSPLHLEYMRNMGQLASMSISIIAHGRLWGLVSCHDRAPRGLDFPTRVACEHLGRLVSLQVESAETHGDVQERLALRERTLQLLAHGTELDATLLSLVDDAPALLGVAGAAGAAVVLDDECRTAGDTPAPAVILELARRIAQTGDEIFATDRLATLPALAPPGDTGMAGVLSLSISQVHRHLILWFRPAVVQTIQWAGQPFKEIRIDGRIHPRRSFASWREELKDRALPWSAAEIGAVRELRQSLTGIVLRRAEELASVATELGRVNKELEAFSYTVSHDLRAPMRHIAGYVDLVLDIDKTALSERARRYLSHVKDATAYSARLVDGLLDFSRMGRAALKRARVDLHALSADLVREASHGAEGRGVVWRIDEDLPTVHADPLLIQVALRNLVSNAVKYSRGRDPAHIHIAAVRRPDGEGVEVIDDGVGFDMRYVGKLFGVFQRLHASEEFEGTGIGLASVRRIVERHGGDVWAHGVPGQGARVGFVISSSGEIS